MNFKELKVSQLREILVDEFGLSKKEAQAIKGKASLIATLEEFTNTMEDFNPDSLLENLDMQTEKVGEVINQPRQEVPNLQPSDPEWTDFVLEQLTDDERIKDKNNPTKEYPTTDGLRRLVEKLIGNIVSYDTIIHQTPCPENERRATVSVKIEIESYLNYNFLMRFSGAADVFNGNSTDPFYKHPVATAETKAEGRAYKKALKIKVSTYEEMAGSGGSELVDSIEVMQEGNINNDQINFIDLLCQRLDINVKKFIESEECSYESIQEVPYEEAGTLLALLQDYQTDKTIIPDDMKGYDNNWQEVFCV